MIRGYNTASKMHCTLHALNKKIRNRRRPGDNMNKGLSAELFPLGGRVERVGKPVLLTVILSAWPEMRTPNAGSAMCSN